MKKSDIEWPDFIWNFVIGCNTGCPYCHAKKHIKEFHKTYIKEEVAYNLEKFKVNDFTGHSLFGLKKFKPTFFNKQFDRDFPVKNKRAIIFVNPFSDIMWWKEEWMIKCIKRIRKRLMAHRFVFLTKHADVYIQYKFPYNCFLGVTINTNEELKNLKGRFNFINFDPLLTEIDIRDIPKTTRWVIIGAEQGNRKNKVVPKREWIEGIVYYCNKYNIPVFMRDSIINVWQDVLIQEYPKFLREGCKYNR